ncbi:MAG: SecD/SecF fusion protein [Thermoleophilaceae bacterium]|nr:SecD/SecF fusion protein [Thermoleophilaceae bacterium]
MSTRARSIAGVVVLASAVALAIALLSSGTDGSPPPAADCAIAHPAQTLVYEARGAATPATLDLTVRRMCERVRALSADGVGVRRSGSREIELQTARAIPTGTIPPIAATAQLQFYDWEPNVLNQNANTPDISLFKAVTDASRLKPKAEAVDIPPGGASKQVQQQFGGDQKKIEAYYDRQNDTAADRYYVFGPDHWILRPGGAAGANDATQYYDSTDEIPTRRPRGTKVIKVPQGIVLIKAESGASASGSLGYWILEDDSELSGADIKNPKQQLDPQTSEPIVTFEFTDKGRAAFARATKREAQRGAQLLAPPGTPNDQKFQRFAIALDNQIVSLATVSFVDNPEGIDGSTGVQINGIGNLKETKALADSLRIGALPVELRLVRIER